MKVILLAVFIRATHRHTNPTEFIRVLKTKPEPHCINLHAGIFDYMIKGYCSDLVGSRFIKRGEAAYQVLRAQDSAIISPSRFPNIIMQGMALEMSIVLREMDVIRGSHSQTA